MREGIWRSGRAHTHTYARSCAMTSQLSQQPGRNAAERGEALWRRGKRREGRKRRGRRRGKGLAREKTGTPTIWSRNEARLE